jgi:cell division initiation protein
VKVTPLDIRRKEFKRSVRGYSDEEVDLFLDQVADDLEGLFQENVELQDRVRRLEEQVAGNVQLRDALEKTLVSAQLQADQTKVNAQKESELILRDAELKARGIVNDSYTEVQRVQQALIQLKHLEEDFRFKFRSLLEGHLKLLEEAPINMGSGRPAVVEPPPPMGATDETPFVVPAAVDEVPEYPVAAQPAVQPESPVAAETAAATLATAAAGLGLAAAHPGPGTPTQPAVAAAESVAEGTGDTETVEQTSIFAEFDKAQAEKRPDGDERPPASRSGDLLSGFFFGGKSEGTDEVFPDDRGGKSKARDFEW